MMVAPDFQVGDWVWVRVYYMLTSNLLKAGKANEKIKPEMGYLLGEIVEVLAYSVHVEVEQDHGKKVYALPRRLLIEMQGESV